MVEGLSQKRWFRVARDVAILLVVLVAVRAFQRHGMVEGKAPEFAGVTLAGERVALRDYRGEPMVLMFWATWCGVCQVEQDAIQALSQDHPVLTEASQSGSGDQVAAYMAEHGLTFATLADPRGVLSRRYSVRAFPSLFILDGEGNIDTLEVGYTSEWGLRLRLWMAAL